MSSDEGGDRVYTLHFEAALRRKELMRYHAIKVPSSQSLAALSLFCALVMVITMVSSLLSREICLLFVSRAGEGVLGVRPGEQTLVKQGEIVVF